MEAIVPIPETDNPVLWKEHIHLFRHAPRWSQLSRIASFMLIGALMVFMVFLWNNSNGGSAMQTGLFVVWILQAAVAVQALAAGANTISREHVGQTWDALVLTGVSARQILIGKYVAALRVSFNMMLTLGVVRLAMLPIFSFGLVKVYAYYVTRSQVTYAYRYDSIEPEFEFMVWSSILAATFAILFTLLDTMTCTAIGLAASAVTKRGMIATIIALSIRFAPVILFAAFMRYDLGATFIWRWWGRTEFALSDAGTSAMMVLSLPLMPWTRGDHMGALPGLILVGTFLVIGLIVSLLITWLMIRRTGALPHPDKNSEPIVGRAFGKS
jgi:hypothetical protein